MPIATAEQRKKKKKQEEQEKKRAEAAQAERERVGVMTPASPILSRSQESKVGALATPEKTIIGTSGELKKLAMKQGGAISPEEEKLLISQNQVLAEQERLRKENQSITPEQQAQFSTEPIQQREILAGEGTFSRERREQAGQYLQKQYSESLIGRYGKYLDKKAVKFIQENPDNAEAIVSMEMNRAMQDKILRDAHAMSLSVIASYETLSHYSYLDKIIGMFRKNNYQKYKDLSGSLDKRKEDINNILTQVSSNELTAPQALAILEVFEEDLNRDVQSLQESLLANPGVQTQANVEQIQTTLRQTDGAIQRVRNSLILTSQQAQTGVSPEMALYQLENG